MAIFWLADFCHLMISSVYLQIMWVLALLENQINFMVQYVKLTKPPNYVVF